TFGRDSDRRLKALVATRSGAHPLSLTYRYDSVGNITEITDMSNGANTIQDFAYDAQNRLISFSENAGSGSSLVQGFAYTPDGTGNRRNLTESTGLSRIARRSFLQSIELQSAQRRIPTKTLTGDSSIPSAPTSTGTLYSAYGSAYGTTANGGPH